MMISKKNAALLFIVFVSALGIFISSCDISDPTEGLEVRLKTISRETTVNMFLKDAIDNSVVAQNTTVTFQGDNAGLIIDVNNRAQTTFTTSSGYITFCVKEGTSFDTENPFKVTVKVQTNGYNEAIKTVSVYTKGISASTLFLVSPAKVETITSTGSAAEGTTDSQGTTQSDINATTTTGSTVSIPAGTNLVSASGVPLVGDLTTTISTIPLASNNISPTLETTEGTTEYPAFQVQMRISDSNGNYALRSSGDIELSIPLSDTDTNPITGDPYSLGDKFNVLKFSEETGEYTKIGETEVTAGTLAKTSNVNNTFKLTVIIPEDPSEPPIVQSNFPFVMTLTIKPPAPIECKFITINSSQPEIMYCSFKILLNNVEKETVPGFLLYSAPDNERYHPIEGAVPGNKIQIQYQGVNLLPENTTLECYTNNLTLDLSTLPTYTINFAAYGVCSDKDPAVIGQLADAAYTYYSGYFRQDLNTGVIKDGSGSVTLTPGTYRIEITYDGHVYGGNITMGSDGEISHSGFDTSNLYFGEISINGTKTTLNASNNPNIQGTNVTVYVTMDCD